MQQYVEDAGGEILDANKNTYNVSDPDDLEELHALLCVSSKFRYSIKLNIEQLILYYLNIWHLTKSRKLKKLTVNIIISHVDCGSSHWWNISLWSSQLHYVNIYPKSKCRRSFLFFLSYKHKPMEIWQTDSKFVSW